MPSADAQATTDLAAARAKLDAGAMLTLAEVAAIMSVPRKTVESWRYRARRGLGGVPPLDYRRFGGVLRVTAASVAAVIGEGGPVGDIVGTDRLRALPWPSGGGR